jgi:hypothetical protein
MLQYIQSLESIAANMIKCGKPVEQASSEKIPSPFDNWLIYENFFVTNLQFLYGLACKKKKQNG